MRLDPNAMEDSGAYMAQIRGFKLLNRNEEREFFVRIDKKEDEFLRELATNPEIFRATIRAIMSSGRQDKKRDSKLAILLEPHDDLGQTFLDLARSNGDIRVFQQVIYIKILENRKRIEDKDWVRRLRNTKEELEELRNDFALRNLRLVIAICRKYKFMCKGIKFLDLVQEGNIGLMKAIEKFDNRMDIKFSTYSSWWIRQSIVRCLIDRNRNVRIPVHMFDRIVKIKRFEARYLLQTGKYPTKQQIAEGTEIPIHHVEKYQAYDPEGLELSIDTPVMGDEGEPFVNMMKGEDDADIESGLISEQLRAALEESMSTLSDVQKYVLSERYGTESKTLAQIGDALSLSRERIRQIEADAFRKVRSAISLKEFLTT